MNSLPFKILLLLLLISPSSGLIKAEIINAFSRTSQPLNGEWHVIIDPNDRGRWDMWKNRKPQNDNEFREYSFDEGLTLNVPGDFNSQMPELKYYEGTVWYGKYFDKPDLDTQKKYLLYFAGVANVADVYLNAEPIGHHEGGFTPFEFDITDKLKDKDNFIAIAVNNQRRPDAIPAMNFDWWNYGGITRDVMIIEVPETYIEDYYVRLNKENPKEILADVKLSQPGKDRKVTISIPELNIKKEALTNDNGEVSLAFNPKKLELWSPENPKLYNISISSGQDSVAEEIGFRNISTDGNQILLNGKPVFLRGVSIHEEIPQRKGRAFSEADAAMLLNEAKELGVNFIRLAHYPQNENMVRLAEKMGFMLWEEIPVWQGIDFSNPDTQQKAVKMMAEMVNRDKNRGSIIIWGMANETRPSESRNQFIVNLKETAQGIDDTKLISAAFDNSSWNKERNVFEIKNDPIIDILDIVGINKYVGWYENWHVDPSETGWDVTPDKPLVFTEFGGEAQYGIHGNENAKHSWSEDFQANLYKKNLRMFDNVPNLAGVTPWILFDFRSPTRFSPLQGLEFNRKGLVSDRGQRKKAWYVMQDYYNKKKEEYDKK